MLEKKSLSWRRYGYFLELHNKYEAGESAVLLHVLVTHPLSTTFGPFFHLSLCIQLAISCLPIPLNLFLFLLVIFNIYWGVASKCSLSSFFLFQAFDSSPFSLFKLTSHFNTAPNTIIIFVSRLICNKTVLHIIFQHCSSFRNKTDLCWRPIGGVA